MLIKLLEPVSEKEIRVLSTLLKQIEVGAFLLHDDIYRCNGETVTLSHDLRLSASSDNEYQFEVLSEQPLASGGDADVFLVEGRYLLSNAQDLSRLDTEPLAMKRLKRLDENEMDKLIQEYDLIQSLEHLRAEEPLLDWNNQISSMCMKYVRGVQLFEILLMIDIDEHVVFSQFRMRLMEALLDAYQHQVRVFGIAHNDIKPENILVDPGIEKRAFFEMGLDKIAEVFSNKLCYVFFKNPQPGEKETIIEKRCLVFIKKPDVIELGYVKGGQYYQIEVNNQQIKSLIRLHMGEKPVRITDASDLQQIGLYLKSISGCMAMVADWDPTPKEKETMREYNIFLFIEKKHSVEMGYYDKDQYCQITVDNEIIQTIVRAEKSEFIENPLDLYEIKKYLRACGIDTPFFCVLDDNFVSPLSVNFIDYEKKSQINTPRTLGGTLLYVPPEVIHSHSRIMTDERGDIYALGKLCWLLWGFYKIGHELHPNDPETNQTLLEKQYQLEFARHRDVFSISLYIQMYDLILTMLHDNIAYRCTFDETMNAFQSIATQYYAEKYPTTVNNVTRISPGTVVDLFERRSPSHLSIWQGKGSFFTTRPFAYEQKTGLSDFRDVGDDIDVDVDVEIE